MKLEYVHDAHGNKVIVGDIVISSINLWRGRDEIDRGTVIRVSPQGCTAMYKVHGERRVKNTKFLKGV